MINIYDLKADKICEKATANGYSVTVRFLEYTVFRKKV